MLQQRHHDLFFIVRRILRRHDFAGHLELKFAVLRLVLVPMVPVCCNELMVQHLFLHQNQNHIRFAATPAAMVPTPTSDTNLTLMRASRLAF
jgi:hypothetical protein